MSDKIPGSHSPSEGLQAALSALGIDSTKNLPIDLFSFNKASSFVPPRLTERNPAEKACERIIERITEFEKDLSVNDEVGFCLTNAPGNNTFHINEVNYLNMDLVVFSGMNSENKKYELVQHVSQINLLLIALPKIGQVARRIGFDLSRDTDTK